MIYYVVTLFYFFRALASYIESKNSANIYRGIRNPHTLRTDEHWKFAHIYNAKIYSLFGLLVFVLTVLGSMVFDYESHTILLVIIQLIPITFVRLITKKRMVKFDEEYRQRLINEGNFKLLAKLYGENK